MLDNKTTEDKEEDELEGKIQDVPTLGALYAHTPDGKIYALQKQVSAIAESQARLYGHLREIVSALIEISEEPSEE